MNTTTPRLVGVGLIGVTVLGSVVDSIAVAAPTSAATGRVATATADFSRGFDIVNLTKHTLQLVAVDSPGNRDGVAPIGTTIAPGQSLHYEKVYYVAQRGETTLHFIYSETLADGTVHVPTFAVTLVVDDFSGTSIRTDADERFTVENKGFTEGRLTLMEKDFSVITVPASDARWQAELLNRSCLSSLASCTFTPQATADADPLVALVAGGANNTDRMRSGSVTTEVVATTTTSVEIAAAARPTITRIVEAGLTREYGLPWPGTREETTGQLYDVGAHMDFTLWARVSMVRVTGDFTVRLGRTTWRLAGVTVTVPDRDADVLYDAAACPLTAHERATLPQTVDIAPIAPTS
ncbi:MAG: hypothetical protein JST25_02330 [Actinobacteria bacterium]|nr:hypothetical protein [Actinomycetota bacterium]